jgi:hypothetical protein
MENKIARSCWFLHKWTKWERYERPIFRIIEGVKYNAVQPHQRRKCIRCGYEQEERIW